ncbi:Hypothetical protein FKW44_006477 [Caligus rogercresseyi]|uniref:Uncharacterized protein n=1 Tax=Caligus rogercresseyi TaxID=217165 RepID=A0A7T8KDE6_CALRO|nr:Hypothetical protein FKW44_006477 [Caligus rogercresseyi]
METRWVAEQKTYNTQRILAKIEKGKNQTKYTQKCLQACKSWGGPTTTVEELNKVLQKGVILLRRFCAQSCLTTATPTKLM